MAKSKKRKEFITGTPLSWSDLMQMHTQISSEFMKRWEVGQENERYYRVKHWTESQEQDFISQGRLPYSFGLIGNKLYTISATQRSARTGFRIESLAPDHEIKAEVANLDIKDFERRTNFRYVESECFDSGIAVQYGAAEVYTDFDEDYNKVVMARPLDYQRVVWDLNAHDYELMDALFKAKRTLIYRKDLREIYGDIADNVVQGDEYTGFDRNAISYWISENRKDGKMKDDFDIVTVLDHYQRVQRDTYCVFFDDVMNLSGHKDDAIVGKFKTHAEADSYLRKISLPYLEMGIRPKDGDIVKKRETKLDKYVFSYVGILEYEETDLDPEECPIVIYRAFHFQNHWWTMSDVLKDPQIFLDRTMSQIDYALGTDVKNVYTLDVNSLADNETASTASRKLTKNGGVIFVNGSKQIPPINPIQSKGANTQYFELFGILAQTVQDLGGGRSFSGQADGSEESGKAIQEKKLQGQLIAGLFVDNLSRWKKRFGNVVLSWIKRFESGERTIKVNSGSLSPEMKQLLAKNGIFSESKTQLGGGYVKINSEGNENSYLKDAKLELYVTEAELTETDAEAKLQQLERAQQLTGQPIPVEVVAPFIDMDESVRQKWLLASKQQQQMQQALMKDKIDKEQQKLDTQKANVLTKTLPKETITHNEPKENKAKS